MILKEQETLGFQSEVKQLLNLMIHSLYSNKEIFLRELISNASDAADKLRFLALAKPDLYEGNGELYVRIICNKEKRTITIIDNGIGMCRTEVIDNLGTIAKSGTKAFLETIDVKNSKNNQLIGQFGVGFYSAFIVAQKVIVRTRAAGASADEGVHWESTGEGDYIIAAINKPERGTEITLFLREGEDEFLDDWRIKNTIGKYSDHITLPIEIATNSENKNNNIITWEQINKAQALWTRNKVDVSDQEYKDFYKHLYHDSNDPISWSHNRVEGQQEYTSLLYIPASASWGIWNRDHKYGLKLYIKRVLIMDHADYFLPNYLRFVKGIIDCNDLPLNISREMLQHNRITQNLKNAITKRILSMLEKLATQNNEQYQNFWQHFGLVIKEGLAEDPNNSKSIARLLRFSTTHSKSMEQNVSLDEYVSRIAEQQEKIYYIIADSYAAANSSPHLELLQKKGIEVLLLHERIDAWMMNYLIEFNGKSFQLVSKADLKLDKFLNENTTEQKDMTKAFEPFIERVKKYLGDRIKEVRLTYSLTDTPAIVTIDSNNMTTHMAKLIVASGQNKPDIKYIFELNPLHPIVKKVSNTDNDIYFSEVIELLLDQALLVECGTLENPNQFVRRINKLLNHDTIVN
ncbi:molecular chaperone HtpG [Candidatus Palibaumannia cicadellinicola]|uniref:Chaperone protein HtpG n=1 Tax=Baumannia cicadellinicola subsp. Homalodisca coagulata TaxID=374463 RepID=HTPG_BAUCH|nr:molecular chaperone HtpG [Candidatus Baumannia cicadellinicola]Q1LTX6.1 RecName: Full=Chaperone protein HtpG; AltName: Full=Heat shock protein HtpG; AltName: Full=High temperature protein G [Baumannia cicadellinicola str. Hc (Homalodisca coagulata)]ABF14114.1 heat shock protein HtpG [Baumannia cicadellinicola str. Hc (Homalodisca coagulata)]MCJ7462430.1 molecular chaperone HtpG [Candidatus Baumannia cicadellinicola]MCJ7463038.1 molecular chaperone HtpG [Candidatus Baumannia cicadellinicola]